MAQRLKKNEGPRDILIIQNYNLDPRLNQPKLTIRIDLGHFNCSYGSVWLKLSVKPKSQFDFRFKNTIRLSKCAHP